MSSNMCPSCQLYSACARNDTAIVKVLLEGGFSPRYTTPGGDTPLHAAAASGNPQILLYLITDGADLNAKDRDGNTALHKGCERSITNAEVLLMAGAEVNATNANGCTPLHLACERGNARIAELLLRFGADKEIADEHGRTPLHIACKNLQWKSRIAYLLLRWGADFEALDNTGNTPWHIAYKYRNTFIFPIFLNLGVDINMNYNSGVLPFECPQDLLNEMPNRRCINMLQVFYEHITKMRCLNKYINPKYNFILDRYAQSIQFNQSEIPDLRADCMEEIGRLKRIIIGPSLSLYDFIRTDADQAIRWLKNDKLLSKLKIFCLRRDFPLLGQIVSFQIHRQSVKKQLLDEAVQVFLQMFTERPFRLPGEIAESVLINLSIRDLRIFTEIPSSPNEFIYTKQLFRC